MVCLIHYIPGAVVVAHGSHVPGHCGQNVMDMKQCYGVKWVNLTDGDCCECLVRHMNCHQIWNGHNGVHEKPSRS